jgi:subtilisin family serine protease
MNKLKIIPVFLLLCSLFQAVMAQGIPRYLVYLKDKTNSPFSVEKPEMYLSERAVARRSRQQIKVSPTDFPVNPAYIQTIRQSGAKVIFSSRWLNAVLVEATDSQYAAVQSLPFYKATERNLPLASTATTGVARLGAVNQKFGTQEAIDYGRMREQLALLGVPALQEKGFKGKGVLIAVLDAGFSRANQVGYLKHLFDEKRIIDTYDFITRDGNVYNDHFHGLNCLSTIAANQPGVMVGAAYEASFALYRTENELSETPYEEAAWLIAAERADSLGADIISCSLGYNTFDDPRHDYTIQDLDGKTALVTRAAQQAVRTGILVVNSAGNSGNDPWKFITSPADADSILAVGATYANRSYAPFSSIGPTADGRIKPDVSAQGVGTVIGNNIGEGFASTGNGTSFSAPQIAGLAAILWQAYPQLTTQQLITVIKKSGHLAANPDNMLGFGVPTIQVAEDIVLRDYPPLGVEPTEASSISLYPNPTDAYVSLRFAANLEGQSADIQLLNASGVVVRQESKTIKPIVTIPIQTLQGGIYFVRVSTRQGVRVLKFIKK